MKAIFKFQIKNYIFKILSTPSTKFLTFSFNSYSTNAESSIAAKRAVSGIQSVDAGIKEEKEEANFGPKRADHWEEAPLPGAASRQQSDRSSALEERRQRRKKERDLSATQI